MEVVYTPTLGLNELNPRWYQVDRRRIGCTGAFDVKPNSTATYTVRGVLTTVFRHTNITFAPNVSATSIDQKNIQANPHNESLANYNFNSQLRAVNFSKDAENVNLLNLSDSLLRYFQGTAERVLQEEHYHWWTEFGVKVRF